MATNISPLALAGHVQRQAELGTQQGESRLVQRLTPAAIGGDPSAIAQVAAVNPQVATAAQTFGDDQLARAKGLIDFLEKADAADPAQAQALWVQHGVPYVRQFAQGTEPTQDWQQAKGMLGGLKAKIAQAEAARAARGGIGGTPTGFRQFEMTAQAAGLKPGTPDYERAARIALGTEAGLARTQPRTLTVDINGVPTQVTFDPATQSYTTANLGGGAPAPGVQLGEPMPYTFDDGGAGIPPRVVSAINASETGPQAAQGGAGAPIIGRTKEAEAGAVTAAQEAARLAALPAELRLRTDAAVEQSRATEQGKADVERASTARQKFPRVANVDRGLSRIDAALSALESGAVKTGPATQIPLGLTREGQELSNAVGAIQEDLLSLTRVPGVGSQSDLEARISALKYPSLGNYGEVNRRNVEQLQAFVRDLKAALGNVSTQQNGGGSPTTPPAAPRRAVNPQTGETLILVNGAWVPEQ